MTAPTRDELRSEIDRLNNRYLVLGQQIYSLERERDEIESRVIRARVELAKAGGK